MTVEKYASNESFQAFCLQTDEEAVRYWTKYIEDNPDQKDIFQEAKKIVHFLQLQISEKEILTEKEKIKPHFAKVAHKTKIQSSTTKTVNLFRAIASIAAIGLIIVVGIYWSGQYLNEQPEMITQSFVEQTKVDLSDGSSIYLSPNASIKHDKEWTSGENREIWLSGKAFFDVNKKPIAGNQQFIVHTAKGKVEVLGTSFTIDADAENFEVILETGELAFHGNNDQTIVLKPGEKVAYENNRLKKEKVNASYYSMWKEGNLVFEDTPVGEIVEVLKASFNMNLEVKNQSLLKRKVTASIPKNDPELLLQALSEIYDIQIIRSKDQIILK